VNGFAGTISISDTVPSGLNCSPLTSNSITGSGTSTLSCSSATQNVYTVTITASTGSLVHTALASFTFGTPPDFTLVATSPSAVNVGASAVSTITIALVHGLASTVSLTDNVPSGLNCGSISNTSISSNGTATVSCTSNIPATYQLTITGTSGTLTHAATVTFTFLAIRGSMTLNLPASKTIDELTTVSFTITGADSSVPTPSLTITTLQLPTGASFSATQGTSPSGTFTWTPDETQTGTFTIIFTITDGVTSIPGYVTVTVVEPNTPPTITAPGPQTVSVGKSLGFTIRAANPSVANDPVALSASGLVQNMAFDPSTGIFSFTPDQSQAGKTFTINFTANYADNPSASRTQQVTITTENASGQSPSGGFCLTCILPGGTTFWLLVVGAMLGVVSSIALVTLRTHLNLAYARRKSQDKKGRYLARESIADDNLRQALLQKYRKRRVLND
jgi:Putative Ig domain